MPCIELIRTESQRITLEETLTEAVKRGVKIFILVFNSNMESQLKLMNYINCKNLVKRVRATVKNKIGSVDGDIYYLAYPDIRAATEKDVAGLQSDGIGRVDPQSNPRMAFAQRRGDLRSERGGSGDCAQLEQTDDVTTGRTHLFFKRAHLIEDVAGAGQYDLAFRRQPLVAVTALAAVERSKMPKIKRESHGSSSHESSAVVGD